VYNIISINWYEGQIFNLSINLLGLHCIPWWLTCEGHKRELSLHEEALCVVLLYS
jgi:hypothetical protein